jgi:1-acyl-sn-glycerol-3-phosphate acyltransferase
VRKYFVFLLLWLLRSLAWPFYRLDSRWVEPPPADPWSHLRVVCLLNHTSLFEWLFILAVPARFLWRVAVHGVIPAAQKTLDRPVVGWFFKSLAANVVSITRERDHTWRDVLGRIDPDSMVLILPEGRMMRRNGLDSAGQPMTVRGGIADILDAVGAGRMLIAYSGGLHRVQAPGDFWPRPFRRIYMTLELVEIADYRAELVRRTPPGTAFKRSVVVDLERRRDLLCPTERNRGRWGASAPPAAVLADARAERPSVENESPGGAGTPTT